MNKNIVITHWVNFEISNLESLIRELYYRWEEEKTRLRITKLWHLSERLNINKEIKNIKKQIKKIEKELLIKQKNIDLYK